MLFESFAMHRQGDGGPKSAQAEAKPGAEDLRSPEFLRFVDSMQLWDRAMAEAGSTVAQQVLALVDDQGRSDYAIPAAGALAMCRANVPEHFEKDWHWSSTQDVRYNAIAQPFADGLSSCCAKVLEFRVRPVRTIQLQHFTA